MEIIHEFSFESEPRWTCDCISNYHQTKSIWMCIKNLPFELLNPFRNNVRRKIKGSVVRWHRTGYFSFSQWFFYFHFLNEHNWPNFLRTIDNAAIASYAQAQDCSTLFTLMSSYFALTLLECIPACCLLTHIFSPAQHRWCWPPHCIKLFLEPHNFALC